jgi:hypothetical protein
MQSLVLLNFFARVGAFETRVCMFSQPVAAKTASIERQELLIAWYHEPPTERRVINFTLLNNTHFLFTLSRGY